MKRKNPVAKHAHQFNKAVVHKDRKKAVKRGYLKHKARPARALYWAMLNLA